MERKTVIVADSSANLFSDSQSSFHAVPMKIITETKQFVDDRELDVEEMLTFLRSNKGRSGTACPSVGDWLEAFGDANEVYGVSLTSNLSGCYNAASIAAEDYKEAHPDRQVFILDSLSTGPESELFVEKLHSLIESGYSFGVIKEKIIQYARRTHLLFSLESLTNFARNGRVSPALATAASLLGIRIVGRASSDGKLEPLHKCRGEKRAVRQLWECMRQSGFSGGKVRIRHSENEGAAQQLAELIKDDFPECDLRIGKNNGLCSYYAEKGGVLVGFEGE